MSKNSIFVTTVQTLADLLFPHFYSIAKDFFETHGVKSDEEDPHTQILEGLKNRDAKTCVKAYTKLIEDLAAMYRQIQGEDSTKDGD